MSIGRVGNSTVSFLYFQTGVTIDDYSGHWWACVKHINNSSAFASVLASQKRVYSQVSLSLLCLSDFAFLVKELTAVNRSGLLSHSLVSSAYASVSDRSFLWSCNRRVSTIHSSHTLFVKTHSWYPVVPSLASSHSVSPLWVDAVGF